MMTTSSLRSGLATCLTQLTTALVARGGATLRLSAHAGQRSVGNDAAPTQNPNGWRWAEGGHPRIARACKQADSIGKCYQAAAPAEHCADTAAMARHMCFLLHSCFTIECGGPVDRKKHFLLENLAGVSRFGLCYVLCPGSSCNYRHWHFYGCFCRCCRRRWCCCLLRLLPV